MSAVTLNIGGRGTKSEASNRVVEKEMRGGDDARFDEPQLPLVKTRIEDDLLDEGGALGEDGARSKASQLPVVEARVEDGLLGEGGLLGEDGARSKETQPLMGKPRISSNDQPASNTQDNNSNQLR